MMKTAADPKDTLARVMRSNLWDRVKFELHWTNFELARPKR